jgi:pheromone shutdown protein TraB
VLEGVRGMQIYLSNFNEKISEMYDMRAKAKAGFYSHLIGFGIITSLIIIFYLLTSLATGQFYFFFPLLALPVWLAIITVHFLSVFWLKRK